MALLNQSAIDYYNDGPFGGYQFTSLEDIINHFMVVYVGEDKLISKIKRVDVAFHAQRALQELSFDTFKSCKSEEIIVPPSLQMVLPQDYVNYTKVSWVDSAGIKHPLYHTSDTSNPTSHHQNDDGEYKIHPVVTLTLGNNDIVLDGDYSDVLIHGMRFVSTHLKTQSFVHGVSTSGGITTVTLANKTGSNITNQVLALPFGTTISEQAEVIRFDFTGSNRRKRGGTNIETTLTTAVTAGDTTIFVADSTGIEIGMFINCSGFVNDNSVGGGKEAVRVIGVGSNTVELSHPSPPTILVNPAGIGDTVTFLPDLRWQQVDDSRTQDNYKSSNPSENQDDYIDDTYWPMAGSRYGLDPQHAQANGSFFVNCDNVINFSSNVSGKLVILDYISDSLGFDSEMKVHKFAEEAMYKWISYAILSTRTNTPEYIVQRYKKERFATIRNAKIRLSNIKLEEITQILRGKSKQIKH